MRRPNIRGDKETRREWKRKFRHDMRGWQQKTSKTKCRPTQNWRAQWQQNWTNHPGAYRGLWFTLSLLTLITVASRVCGFSRWFRS